VDGESGQDDDVSGKEGVRGVKGMAKEDNGLGGGREGVAMDGCRRWLRRMGEGRAKRDRGMKGMVGQY